MASASTAHDDKMDLLKAFLESPQTSSLAKKQLVLFLTDVREIHDTTEDYERDINRHIDRIRIIQRKLLEFDPALTLNVVQLAFLLQMDYDYLKGLQLSEIIEMTAAAGPFVKACKLD
jgi:hypothetical protein